jgi:CRISPR-associated protein Cas5d
MIRLEVWGDYACFTRPELKSERMSYDVPTPSAARGLVEAIYYHPGLCWKIDRIYVLNPIQFVTIRRNEVKNKCSALTAKRAAIQKKPLYLAASQEIVQRSSLVLHHVHYVIEAHFVMTGRAAPGDNPGKFQDMVTRRIRRGQCFHTPYLGCREFPAHFRPFEGQTIPSIAQTRDLGLMLYDFDYTDPQKIVPTYFRAKLQQGVVNVAGCEVLR